MDRNIFDEAIGDVPPSTVDVDAVVARQRRAALVRGLGTPAAVAAAAVVAVTVGAALAVPGGLGSGSGGPSQQPSGAPTPTISPCAQPSDLPPIPGEPAEVAARLRAALDAAVREQLPDAQLTANSMAVYDGRQYEPLEFVHVYQEGANYGGSCQGHQDYYLARATVTDPAGTGSILASVGRVEEPGSFMLQCSATSPERTFCQERTGPGGERITVTTLVVGEGAIVHRIDAVRPDGTMVTVDSQNVGSDIKEDGPAQRPTPPLTHDQLIAIALIPGLTLFP